MGSYQASRGNSGQSSVKTNIGQQSTMNQNNLSSNQGTLTDSQSNVTNKEHIVSNQTNNSFSNMDQNSQSITSGNDQEDYYPLEQEGEQQPEKSQDQINSENNANTIRNVAKVAKATKNPYAMAAGYAVDISDKLSGGKSSELLGQKLNQANKFSPGGKYIQEASNKLAESGMGDKIGQAADIMNSVEGGKGDVSKNAGNVATNGVKSGTSNTNNSDIGASKDLSKTDSGKSKNNSDSIFSTNSSFLTGNIMPLGGINKKYIILVLLVIFFVFVLFMTMASGKDQNALSATNNSEMTHTEPEEDIYGDSDYAPSTPNIDSSGSSSSGDSNSSGSSSSGNSNSSDSSSSGDSNSSGSSSSGDSNSSSSSYNFTVDSNNINGHGGRKLNLGESLLSLLGQDKIDKWNKKISNDVSNAPTKNKAVASAGYNLIQGALDEGIILPYFMGGGHGVITVGVDSSMGSSKKIDYGSNKQPVGSYWPWGYDCSGFVSWAIKNGACSNFSPRDTTGFLNLPGKVKISIENAKAGDIAVKSGHVVLIINNTGSKLQVAEAKGADYGIIFNEYNYNYFNSYEIIDMSVYYQNYC